MRLKNFLYVCVLSLLSTACAEFEPGQTIDLTVQPNDVGGQNTVISAAPVAVEREEAPPLLPRPAMMPETTNQDRMRTQLMDTGSEDFRSIQGKPKLQPIPNFPPPKDRDLRIIADKMAGEKVEIYDLDKPVPRGAVSRSAPIGIPSAVDSRVTVYPLDPGPAISPFGNQRWPNDVMQMPGKAPAPVRPAPKPSSSEGGHSDAAGQIYFDHGSASVGSAGQTLIGAVSAQRPAALTVEGHASNETEVEDAIQAKIINLRQSMDRAFEVSKGLIQQGVPPQAVKTVAWGDAQATSDEARSRRVDIRAGHR